MKDSEKNIYYQFPTVRHSLNEEEQARRLLAIAIARQSTFFIQSQVVTKIALNSSQLQDGMKRRLIGKDGKNIRYFEEQSGVDILMNEEADAIYLSSFDAFRRETARVALEYLIRDGRIHTGKIEEALIEAKKQVDVQVREAGQLAADKLALVGIHPALLRVLGTLKFRTSFGQNQLEHSIESAWLCGNLASELGFDAFLGRRAGLLHDLGKGLDQAHTGSHAQAGADFAKKYGESDFIVQAIASHHEEILPESWLDHLLIAADALSGGRPGARPGSTQNMLERSEKMEEIALSISGVKQAYAIQAGRELRVFVDSEQVSDEKASEIVKTIANQIHHQLQFPGEIRVTILREKRWTEVVSK